MTKIVSFIGFVFGFVMISVLLAAWSQPSDAIAAPEEFQTACAGVRVTNDGYGLHVVAPDACQSLAD
jgi:hypothetical protein